MGMVTTNRTARMIGIRRLTMATMEVDRTTTLGGRIRTRIRIKMGTETMPGITVAGITVGNKKTTDKNGPRDRTEATGQFERGVMITGVTILIWEAATPGRRRKIPFPARQARRQTTTWWVGMLLAAARWRMFRLARERATMGWMRRSPTTLCLDHG